MVAFCKNIVNSYTVSIVRRNIHIELKWINCLFFHFCWILFQETKYSLLQVISILFYYILKKILSRFIGCFMLFIYFFSFSSESETDFALDSATILTMCQINGLAHSTILTISISFEMQSLSLSNHLILKKNLFVTRQRIQNQKCIWISYIVIWYVCSTMCVCWCCRKWIECLQNILHLINLCCRFYLIIFWFCNVMTINKLLNNKKLDNLVFFLFSQRKFSRIS